MPMTFPAEGVALAFCLYFGQLVFMLSLLAWFSSARRTRLKCRLGLGLLITAFASGLLICIPWLDIDPVHMLLMVYPLMIAAGLSGDIRFTSITNAMLFSLLLSVGLNPFAGFTAEQNFVWIGVFSATGCVLSLFIAACFAQHRSLIDDWRRLSQIDCLSGVSNRRHFLECAAHAVTTAHATHQPLAVLMLDIDHFKQVNDTYGHEAGDAVLRAIVGACTGCIRTHDVMGRLGGEEFAILLRQTDPAQALQIAEQLRDRVSRTAIPRETGTMVRRTVSVGVSSLRAHETLDKVLRRADVALLAAKRSGRNRVALADGDQPESGVWDGDSGRRTVGSVAW